jgi:hypothetical protein
LCVSKYLSSLLFKIELNNFPIHELIAMPLLFSGFDGSLDLNIGHKYTEDPKLCFVYIYCWTCFTV